MRIVKLREESIKLGQALKAAGLADSGADAKYAVLAGQVKVNGQIERRRGRKLTDGDVAEYGGETVKIEA